MSKPIIIIADADERYMAPLEVKFLEELGDSIDLEIITDEDYFNRFFSSPRSADIFVVSENLYSKEIHRHNISNVFVLSENMSDSDTDGVETVKIFKYTSIKDIYNQIMATSSGAIKDSIQKNKATQTILVYSPIGGSGKTTVAMALCSCLSHSFKKVLYINAERMNSFQHYINKKLSTIPGIVCSEIKNSKREIYSKIRPLVYGEKFDCIPPFGAALSSLDLDFSIYKDIIDAFKDSKEYDVIIVDTDSVFDEGKADLITEADKVVIVVKQTKVAAHTTNILLKNMSCGDSEKYFFVCNDFDKEKRNYFNDPEFKLKINVCDYIKHIDNIEEKTFESIDVQELSLLLN